MQNGFVESFNGRLRDECLNEHFFASLAQARRIIEDRRIDCNTNRPHTSLNGLTRTESAARPIQGITRTDSPSGAGSRIEPVREVRFTDFEAAGVFGVRRAQRRHLSHGR
jgi:hypothetical protein